ncbi:MAG TPA: hypothetical protein VN081_06775 [Dongiaceae bacterium]|nr:hypothetical protein [Dongiaceae bacterium]
MKDPRNIVIKTLFNADEYSAFRDACNDADITQSKQLRDLANNWVTQRNDRRRFGRGECPGAAQKQAMFLPGRVRFAGRTMSMRM